MIGTSKIVYGLDTVVQQRCPFDAVARLRNNEFHPVGAEFSSQGKPANPQMCKRERRPFRNRNRFKAAATERRIGTGRALLPSNETCRAEVPPAHPTYLPPLHRTYQRKPAASAAGFFFFGPLDVERIDSNIRGR
jgi:hypothetical protein